MNDHSITPSPSDDAPQEVSATSPAVEETQDQTLVKQSATESPTVEADSALDRVKRPVVGIAAAGE